MDSSVVEIDHDPIVEHSFIDLLFLLHGDDSPTEGRNSSNWGYEIGPMDDLGLQLLRSIRGFRVSTSHIPFLSDVFVAIRNTGRIPLARYLVTRDPQHLHCDCIRDINIKRLRNQK